MKKLEQELLEKYQDSINIIAMSTQAMVLVISGGQYGTS